MKFTIELCWLWRSWGLGISLTSFGLSWYRPLLMIDFLCWGLRIGWDFEDFDGVLKSIEGSRP